MNCSVCGKWVPTDSLPTYYVGPNPRSLEGATAVFCSPECSLEWYEAQKNEVQKDSKR